MEILFKLLLAHFVCDFMLQWSTLLENKVKNRFLSPYLYLHGFIHFAVSAILIFDLSWFLPLLIISTTHTIIDGLKVTYSTRENERVLFFADQLAHVAIIVAVWAYVSSSSIDIVSAVPHFWAHLTAIIFVTFPASIMIQKIFLKWSLPDNAQDSLSGVGAYIGLIERILVYIAVVTGHWSLVGFLIAAKSVFRFGDFSKASERKYAEYLFVGTLLSLFMAIMAGLLVLAMTGQSISK